MSEGKILKKDDFNFGAFLVNNALVLVAVVMVISQPYLLTIS